MENHGEGERCQEEKQGDKVGLSDPVSGGSSFEFNGSILSRKILFHERLSVFPLSES